MAKGRYHHGDLRTALLDAAEALVRERGVDGWSLREASARVGVSPSAAYHHFASRDTLVRALSERTLAWLGEHLRQECERAPAQRSDPQQRLVALARGYVNWALEDPAVARLVLRGGATGPHSSIPTHPHDVLTAELDRLAEAGGLPAPGRQGAEFVLWAAIHGLAVLLADGLIRIDGSQAVDLQTERVVRSALNGLAQETSPAAGWPAAHSAHTERLARRRSTPEVD
ncbi:AcrR family transcriptional regulator [Thermocatellispora tengchongensis]|uniref:AcrR family transcriptional regulator n=1 Tax=Thermocatellispora tengchongensis TaxID=1073253 RepID=A0A840PK32_9ACTN|nr:TetR/AcrR family transcriptional regulator [Thermocatellispora tengchongensis]MBB5139276.1 AcrR family transcriptional regulator [Thermocatellispora tengchongensis]